MNRIFKKVFNAARGMWVVVNETVTSAKQATSSLKQDVINCAVCVGAAGMLLPGVSVAAEAVWDHTDIRSEQAAEGVAGASLNVVGIDLNEVSGSGSSDKTLKIDLKAQQGGSGANQGKAANATTAAANGTTGRKGTNGATGASKGTAANGSAGTASGSFTWNGESNTYPASSGTSLNAWFVGGLEGNNIDRALEAWKGGMTIVAGQSPSGTRASTGNAGRDGNSATGTDQHGHDATDNGTNGDLGGSAGQSGNVSAVGVSLVSADAADREFDLGAISMSAVAAEGAAGGNGGQGGNGAAGGDGAQGADGGDGGTGGQGQNGGNGGDGYLGAAVGSVWNSKDNLVLTSGNAGTGQLGGNGGMGGNGGRGQDGGNGGKGADGAAGGAGQQGTTGGRSEALGIQFSNAGAKIATRQLTVTAQGGTGGTGGNGAAGGFGGKGGKGALGGDVGKVGSGGAGGLGGYDGKQWEHYVYIPGISSNWKTGGFSTTELSSGTINDASDILAYINNSSSWRLTGGTTRQASGSSGSSGSTGKTASGGYIYTGSATTRERLQELGYIGKDGEDGEGGSVGMFGESGKGGDGGDASAFGAQASGSSALTLAADEITVSAAGGDGARGGELADQDLSAYGVASGIAWFQSEGKVDANNKTGIAREITDAIKDKILGESGKGGSVDAIGLMTDLTATADLTVKNISVSAKAGSGQAAYSVNKTFYTALQYDAASDTYTATDAVDVEGQAEASDNGDSAVAYGLRNEGGSTNLTSTSGLTMRVAASNAKITNEAVGFHVRPNSRVTQTVAGDFSLEVTADGTNEKVGAAAGASTSVVGERASATGFRMRSGSYEGNVNGAVDIAVSSANAGSTSATAIDAGVDGEANTTFRLTSTGDMSVTAEASGADASAMGLSAATVKSAVLEAGGNLTVSNVRSEGSIVELRGGKDAAAQTASSLGNVEVTDAGSTVASKLTLGGNTVFTFAKLLVEAKAWLDVEDKATVDLTNNSDNLSLAGTVSNEGTVLFHEVTIGSTLRNGAQSSAEWNDAARLAAVTEGNVNTGKGEIRASVLKVTDGGKFLNGATANIRDLELSAGAVIANTSKGILNHIGLGNGNNFTWDRTFVNEGVYNAAGNETYFSENRPEGDAVEYIDVSGADARLGNTGVALYKNVNVMVGAQLDNGLNAEGNTSALTAQLNDVSRQNGVTLPTKAVESGEKLDLSGTWKNAAISGWNSAEIKTGATAQLGVAGAESETLISDSLKIRNGTLTTASDALLKVSSTSNLGGDAVLEFNGGQLTNNGTILADKVIVNEVGLTNNGTMVTGAWGERMYARQNAASAAAQTARLSSAEASLKAAKGEGTTASLLGLLPSEAMDTPESTGLNAIADDEFSAQWLSGTHTVSSEDFDASIRNTADVTVTDSGSVWAQYWKADGNVTNAGTINLINLTADEESQMSLAGGKTLTNTGTLYAEGLLVVNQGATLTGSGTFSFGADVGHAGQAQLVNKGTIEFTGTTAEKLTNAEDFTYYHDGGTITSNTGAGWFKKATIVVNSGTLDLTTTGGKILQADNASAADSTGTLGANNTYLIGTGSPNPTIEDSANNTAATISGMATVKVDKLGDGSTSSVTVISGGILSVGGAGDRTKNALKLTSDAQLRLEGGFLQTDIYEIFEDLRTEAIRIPATSPEDGTTQITTEVLTSTNVGSIHQDILNHKDSFVSGGLIFDNPDLTFSTSLITSAMNALSSADITGLELHFIGTSARDFTVDEANLLKSEQERITGSAVMDPGVVLDTTTLVNTVGGTATDRLTIGTSTTNNSVDLSIGFKNISKASGVDVNNNRTLVLLGNDVATEGAIKERADADKLLADATDGGDVTVSEGKLELGSFGTASRKQGWVNAVTTETAGALVVKNGDYAINNLTNKGTANITTGGALHVSNYTDTADAALTNDEQLIFDVKTGETAAPTATVAGTLTNNKLLNAAAVDAFTVTGTLTNAANASSPTTMAEFKNLTIDGEGVVRNTAEGSAQAQLRVSNLLKTTGGRFENTGVATVESLLAESGSVLNGTADGTESTARLVARRASVESGASLTNQTGALFRVGTDATEGETDWSETELSTETDDFTIEGTVTNTGTLDATRAGATQAVGTMTNSGTALFDDLTVTGEVTVTADGIDRGDILDIAADGEYVNAGTSRWNALQTAGEDGKVTQIVNSGLQMIGLESQTKEENVTASESYFTLGVNTTYQNSGTLNLEKAGNANVAGTLSNTGIAQYDDLRIESGGLLDNGGREAGDQLSVGGTWQSAGTSAFNAVTVDEDAEALLSGTTEIGTARVAGMMTVSGGTTAVTDYISEGGMLRVTGGLTTIANSLELSRGSTLYAMGDSDAVEETAGKLLITSTALNNPLQNGLIGVSMGGELGLGDGSLELGDAVGLVRTSGKSRVTVTDTTVKLESTALGVGSQDRALTSGSAAFGSDSVTLVAAGRLLRGQDTAAFEGTGSLTVKEGATLVLTGLTESGDYLIARGFTLDGIEGWNTSDTLYALPSDASGLGYVLTLLEPTGDEIWVGARYEDIGAVYPDIAIPNITNDALNESDSEAAGDKFITDTLRDPTLTNRQKTTIINSVMEIGYAAGTAAAALSNMKTVADSVGNRMSLDVDNSDKLSESLWIDVLTNKGKATRYEAKGKMIGGYSNNAYGFVTGIDHRDWAHSTKVGAAISMMRGSTESSGDYSPTKGSYDSWGMHLYGAYTPSDRFNAEFDVGLMRMDSDVTQTIGTQNWKSAAADNGATVLTAGVKLETSAKQGRVTATPYVGARFVYVEQDRFTTKLDGEKAYENTPDSIAQVWFPAGIRVTGEVETSTGLTARPSIDVSMTPIFGNKTNKTTVANHRDVKDTVWGKVSGDLMAGVKVGLELEGRNKTFGIHYGLTAGDAGRVDQSIKAEARIRF